PIEGGVVTTNFEVRVSDSNGYADIDDSSVRVDFFKATETNRSGTCSLSVPDVESDGLASSYSCSVNMWYYDQSGSWTINVYALDDGANPASNKTRTLTYNVLNAMQIVSPIGSLSWLPLASGAQDQGADNDPSVINNTGNFDGTIRISAYELDGETTPGEYINSTFFSVSGVSGNECTGVPLGYAGNAVDTLISSNRGPPNLVSEIYYCLDVPIVSAQAYSTSIRGASFSWSIIYQ
ncbi:MAG: hypothetical protein KKB31_03105, partial [Nanoarchaeota archaeon]|nr:hypothetical protein [Nanoarchaeota archaeon]